MFGKFPLLPLHILGGHPTSQNITDGVVCDLPVKRLADVGNLQILVRFADAVNSSLVQEVAGVVTSERFFVRFDFEGVFFPSKV